MDPNPPTDFEDFLVGAAAIGKFVKVNQRKAFYRLEYGLIPGFKVGRLWYARKSSILNRMAERERAAQEQPAKVRPRAGRKRRRRSTTGSTGHRAC